MELEFWVDTAVATVGGMALHWAINKFWYESYEVGQLVNRLSEIQPEPSLREGDNHTRNIEGDNYTRSIVADITNLITGTPAAVPLLRVCARTRYVLRQRPYLSGSETLVSFTSHLEVGRLITFLTKEGKKARSYAAIVFVTGYVGCCALRYIMRKQRKDREQHRDESGDDRPQ